MTPNSKLKDGFINYVDDHIDFTSNRCNGYDDVNTSRALIVSPGALSGTKLRTVCADRRKPLLCVVIAWTMIAIGVLVI